MSGPSLKVLIVDDDPDVYAQLQAGLRDCGFTAWVAGDGVEAMRLAEQRRPDAIVLDLSMPRMDGLDVAKQLAGRVWRADLLLIAYTAHGDDRARAVTRRLGFDLHLVKPTPCEVMAAAIRDWRAQSAQRQKP